MILSPAGGEVSAIQLTDAAGRSRWVSPSATGWFEPAPGSRVVDFPKDAKFWVCPSYEECEARDIGVKIPHEQERTRKTP